MEARLFLTATSSIHGTQTAAGVVVVDALGHLDAHCVAIRHAITGVVERVVVCLTTRVHVLLACSRLRIEKVSLIHASAWACNFRHGAGSVFVKGISRQSHYSAGSAHLNALLRILEIVWIA